MLEKRVVLTGGAGSLLITGTSLFETWQNNDGSIGGTADATIQSAAMLAGLNVALNPTLAATAGMAGVVSGTVTLQNDLDANKPLNYIAADGITILGDELIVAGSAVSLIATSNPELAPELKVVSQAIGEAGDALSVIGMVVRNYSTLREDIPKAFNELVTELDERIATTNSANSTASQQIDGTKYGPAWEPLSSSIGNEVAAVYKEVINIYDPTLLTADVANVSSAGTSAEATFGNILSSTGAAPTNCAASESNGVVVLSAQNNNGPSTSGTFTSTSDGSSTSVVATRSDGSFDIDYTKSFGNNGMTSLVQSVNTDGSTQYTENTVSNSDGTFDANIAGTGDNTEMSNASIQFAPNARATIFGDGNKFTGGSGSEVTNDLPVGTSVLESFNLPNGVTSEADDYSTFDGGGTHTERQVTVDVPSMNSEPVTTLTALWNQFDSSGNSIGNPNLQLTQNGKAIPGSELANDFGSSIGQFLGNGNVFTSILGGTAGSVIGQEIAGSMIAQDAIAGLKGLWNSITDTNTTTTGISAVDSGGQQALGDISGVSATALKQQTISALSSIIVADAAQAIGLNGFKGQIFTAAGTSIVNALATNVVDAVSSGDLSSLTADGLLKGINFISIDKAIGASIAKNLVLSINGTQTEIQSLLSSVGSTYAGSAYALEIQGWVTTYVAPQIYATASEVIGEEVATAIGTEILPVIGTVIGAAIGAEVGSLLGSFLDDITGGWFSGLFDSPPWDYQFTTFDSTTNSLDLYKEYAKNTNSGLRNGVTSLTQAFTGTVNGIVSLIGGTVDRTGLDSPDVANGNAFFAYVNSDKDWGNDDFQVVFGTEMDPSGGYSNHVDMNKDPTKIVRMAVEYELSKINFINGDPVLLKAFNAWKASIVDPRSGADLDALMSDLQVAQDYNRYVNNTSTINALIAADPNSAFSVGWSATLLQAESLGLNQPYQLTVTNTNDSGVGSLRQAILDANRLGSANILFRLNANDPNFHQGNPNLPPSSLNPDSWVIQPKSPLPALDATGAITISGLSQPGVPGDTVSGALEIILDGEYAGAGANGLTLSSSNNVVEALTIIRFGGSGIVVNASSNRIDSDFIGTDTTGRAGIGNASSGILVEGGALWNLIEQDVVSENGQFGVRLTGTGTNGNVLDGNFIGTTPDGKYALGNRGPGVEIDGGAKWNAVGGTSKADRNIISGNSSQGVAISGDQTEGNQVQGNFIGLDVSGLNGIANSADGVLIQLGAISNTIGGTTSGSGNLIAANMGSGVGIDGPTLTSTTVEGNTIGLSLSGQVLGNALDGVDIRDGSHWNVVQSNTISGNAIGIQITSDGADGNIIQGNSIGTTPDGLQSRPNRGAGIEIDVGAEWNLIKGNRISGNLSDGINVSSIGNNFQGNLIGISANGGALPNYGRGIYIGDGADSNSIGGASIDLGNIIAANLGAGIRLDGSAASATAVSNNVIGFSASGGRSLPNGGTDVVVGINAPQTLLPYFSDVTGSIQSNNQIATAVKMISIYNPGSNPPPTNQKNNPEPIVRSLIPAYFGPVPAALSDWQQVINGNVPGSSEVTLIVNVGSGAGGVGGGPDIPNGWNTTVLKNFYRQVLVEAYEKGINLLGYVSTNYGNRPLASVEQDIADWKSLWPGITGIFLDETAAGTAADPGAAKEKLGYYESIRTDVISLFGPTQNSVSDPRVVTNEGTPGSTPQDLELYLGSGTNVPVSDIMLIEEDVSVNSYVQPSWVTNYAPGRFAMALYKNSSLNAVETAANSLWIGNYYVTDDGADGNPWDRLPGYVTDELTWISNLNSTPFALGDSYATLKNTSTNITPQSLLQNDRYAAANATSINVVTNPTHGTLATEPDGSFMYTPKNGYVGPDSFSYSITNGNLTSNTATVNLNVITVPTVTAPTSTTPPGTIATLGGNVASDGGSQITERGVIYSLLSVNPNPQIGGTGVTKLMTTGTTGVFTVNVSNLSPNSVYCFVAYARNGVGTTYTTPVSTFATGPVTVAAVYQGHGPTLIHAGNPLTSSVSAISVQFSDNVNSVAGGANSVTNPSNWLLFRYGIDVSDEISGITFTANPNTLQYVATASFSVPLFQGGYRLIARQRIQDGIGRPLDGDGNGIPGGDFGINFYVAQTVGVTSDVAPYLNNVEPTPLNAVATLTTPVTSALSVFDADSNNWTSATVQITINYQNGEDLLGFTNAATPNITASWNAATGTLTLSGTDTVSDYRTALQNVTYHDSSATPNTSLTRTINFRANDGLLLSNVVTRDVTVMASSIPAVLSGVNGTGTFFQGYPAIALAPNLVITDPNTVTLSSATVSFTNWQGEDRLDFNNIFADQHTFTQDLVAHTATFTIMGADLVDHYQTLLRSVLYWDVSGAPVTSARVASFSVTDGLSTSNVVTRNTIVTAVNQPPTLTSIETTSIICKANDPAYPPQPISNTLLVGDPDSNNLTKATVQITSGYENDANGNDVLAFANQLGITGAFNAATGTLTLTGTSSVSNYRTALRSVTFSSSGPAVSSANRTLTIIATDDYSPTPANSLAATRTVTVVTTNSPPGVTGISSTALSYVRGSAAVAVAPSLLIFDPDSINMAGATVQISGNYQNGQDVLAATTGFGITGSFNSATGTLTLSGVSSIANYQTVLQSITYKTNTAGASTATRMISLTVNDGLANSSTVARSVTLS